MDKIEYFPRKKLFEESQDLIASFYSKGSYASEQIYEMSTMLNESNEKDYFFYCLYLLSMLSNANEIIKIVDRIIKNLNSNRRIKKVNSTEEFIGDIDIERYIQKNYVERVIPKEYPSLVKYSSFQLPEYQLTLFVLQNMETIIRAIYSNLEVDHSVSMFSEMDRYLIKIENYSNILEGRYGVKYQRRDAYIVLKKKVIYRYRNRKIVNQDYKMLMNYFERMLQFKGIDLNSKHSLEVFEYTPEFDDRLYEIWLIRKSAILLADKVGAAREEIKYTPLYLARKRSSCVVSIEPSNTDFRVEILFQNRKNIMPKKELKWYFLKDTGEQEEIGAIPDLVFLKYDLNNQDPTNIVLIDAKNRTWTLDHPEPIKAEVVQQIYIHDNFISLFHDKYYSMLVAHNIDKLQTRKYYNKDHKDYEIDVISLDMNESEIINSLNVYITDLCTYLDV